MHQIESYELHSPSATALSLKAGGMVRVVTGRVWLTLQGQSLDVWLQAGEAWQMPLTGTLWLSAEPAAAFQLVQPKASKHLGWWAQFSMPQTRATPTPHKSMLGELSPGKVTPPLALASRWAFRRSRSSMTSASASSGILTAPAPLAALA